MEYHIGEMISFWIDPEKLKFKEYFCIQNRSVINAPGMIKYRLCESSDNITDIFIEKWIVSYKNTIIIIDKS